MNYLNHWQELSRKLMPLMPWHFRLKWWARPLLRHICPLVGHSMGGWRIGDSDGDHCDYCNELMP